jgi:superfamily II DNA or RNA helicase
MGECGFVVARLDAELAKIRKALAAYYPLREGPSTQNDWLEASALAVKREYTLVRSATRPLLFDYQSDLVSQVVSDFPDGCEGLLSLPTGGGKTRTAVVTCLDGMAAGFLQNVAWLAPTRELVDQAIATFVAMWHDHGAAPDLRLDAGGPESDAPLVWVTTVQAVYAKMRRRESMGVWDAVYFDEAHQMPAKTFSAAVAALRSAGRPAHKRRRSNLIGLSATPGRTNEGGTESLVQAFAGRLLTSKLLGEDPVLTLQRRGVLSRLEFRKFTARQIDEEDVISRLRVAIKACEVFVGKGSHILVFTRSVADAVGMAEVLNGMDIPAQSVHSQMPMRDRLAALDAFRRLECSVLTNQRLLATGYDCPAVSDVMLLSRVGSPILFEQMVGRAARGPRTGGSSVARIWQFEDHLAIHGLPSSYYRYRDYDWSV